MKDLHKQRACGAREILPPCAQLLWFELYAMKDLNKKEPVTPGRFFRPALSFCGVSCML